MFDLIDVNKDGKGTMEEGADRNARREIERVNGELVWLEAAIATRPLEPNPLRTLVENKIAPLLPHAEARASAIAKQLGLSERTFSRRLQSEGLTFHEILDDLRGDLAARNLEDRGKEREAFWKRIDALGTPRSRLLALHKRKAQWVGPGLTARVRHLRGEEKLRHATIQAIVDQS